MKIEVSISLTFSCKSGLGAGSSGSPLGGGWGNGITSCLCFKGLSQDHPTGLWLELGMSVPEMGSRGGSGTSLSSADTPVP